MAKQKTKDVGVVDAFLSAPKGTDKLALRAEVKKKLAKQAEASGSVDDNFEKFLDREDVFNALDKAKDSDLSDDLDTLIKLKEGQEVRGIFLGHGVLERHGETLNDVPEIWLLVRGKDGVKRPRKLHATTALEQSFSMLSPGAGVVVELVEIQDRQGPDGEPRKFHDFRTRPLLGQKA